jgi:ethanolamine ammonia-lyase small subunit
MSDPWQNLRQFTQARIGLERHGHAISTAAWLELQLAQAEARDAVRQPWDPAALADRLKRLDEETILVASQVSDRAEFLQRPDLGRQLSHASRQALSKRAATDPPELAVIVTDGLSAKAIDAHFLAFWKTLALPLSKTGIRRGPIVLAPFGRVALSDAVGEALRARLAVVFVGERPGLSANDSLGIYLTYDPRPGNHDALRNCISNVRPPRGLDYETAGVKLLYLVQESLRLKLSGIGLKEDAAGALGGGDALWSAKACLRYSHRQDQDAPPGPSS